MSIGFIRMLIIFQIWERASLGTLVSDRSSCILDKDGLDVTNGFWVMMRGKKKG